MPGGEAFFKPPPKPKKRRRWLRNVSPKRLLQNRQYSKMRREFLLRPENQICPVIRMLEDRSVGTSEVHHRNGREGERLLDERYWLAVSRQGHRWIHDNPAEARVLGWLLRS